MAEVTEFAQAYYTSSRTGLAGGPGFQTKAITEGVPADCIRLLEAYVGGYRLPPGRDTRTEAGQPVSFKAFSPGRGLWCVSLTHYKKFDWTGEGIGNLFAHSLLCSREQYTALGADAFGFYHSGCYRSEDSGTATTLAPLPVPLPPRPIGPALEALRGVVGSKDRLAALLSALLTPEAGRPVVVVADPEDTLVMFEGLLALLPAAIRAGISFSSFEATKPPVRTDQPQVPGATEVLSLTGTTGCSYTDAEAEQTCFLFDYEANRFSTVPSAGEYVVWAADLVFQLNTAAAEECLQFLSLFPLTARNLDAAWRASLLPQWVLARDVHRAESALTFLDAEMRTPEQGAAGLEKILAAAEGSVHEDRIAGLALAAAARFVPVRVPEVYARFLGAVASASRAGERNRVSQLMGKTAHMPPQYQIKLVEDLGGYRIPAADLVEALAGALKPGVSRLAPGQQKVLYDSLLRMLEEQLEQGDSPILARLLELRRLLGREEQLRLPLEIRSGKNVPAQLALIEVALGIARAAGDEKSANELEVRLEHLFETALQRGRIAEAVEILARAVPALFAACRAAFVRRCLDDRLASLWAVVGKLEGSEADALISRWLAFLLEGELRTTLALSSTLRRDLESSGARIDLAQALAAAGIQKPSVRDGPRSGEANRVVVMDSEGAEYLLTPLGDRLQVWRVGDAVYRERLGKVLSALAAPTGGAPRRGAAWEVVAERLRKGTILISTPDVFGRLCGAVGRQVPENERTRFVRNHLAPMLVGISDRKSCVRALILCLVEPAPGVLAVSGMIGEFSDLLRQLNIEMDDLRAVCSQHGSEELYRLYWTRLEGDRTEVDVELRRLYQENFWPLFDYVARRAVTRQRGRVELVESLLRTLPQLAGDVPRLTNLFQACRESQEGWPGFVRDMHKVLQDGRWETAIGCLARQCLVRLREAVRTSETALTPSETEVLGAWLDGSTVPPDRAEAAAIRVFAELLRFRCNEKDFGPMVDAGLLEYGARGAQLTVDDYRLATVRVFRALAQYKYLLEQANWGRVVGFLNGHSEDRDRGAELMGSFLALSTKRSDYTVLLASLTLEWIRNWGECKRYKSAIRNACESLDKREKKEYQQMVAKHLPILDGFGSSEGIRWWRDTFGGQEESGFLGRFFGKK